MTIQLERIQLHNLKMQLKKPFKTSFGTLEKKEFYIIEAIDSYNNHGYGESVAFTSPWYTEETVKTNLHMMKDFLIPLIRENQFSHPGEIHKIFLPVKRNNMAKAALEGAIWDLYAKKKNIPLSRAIGGSKKKIEAGISIGIKSTINELLHIINNSLEEGYKRIKIKIKPGWDVELLREVRRHFPETAIMADANSAYTLKDLEHLRQLDEFNLMMIEQPLAHNDIIDHAKLQSKLATPICLDESITSLEDARKAIELGSCKVINIKIGRVGGISEAIRIHDLCKENNIAVWCGGMLEAGVGRAHNIALATLSNFVLPGDIAGSSHYWEQDIIQPEVAVKDGMINVPEKPGIGYDLDHEAISSFTSDVTTFDL